MSQASPKIFPTWKFSHLRKNWHSASFAGVGRPRTSPGIVNGKRTRTYMSWQSMKRRGLEVCERWRHFVPFLEDMGERPEGANLCRLDAEKGYERGNCRWLTPTELATLKRERDPAWRPGSLADKCRATGMDYQVAYQRIKVLGWPEERALREPIRVYATRRAGALEEEK